MVVTMIDDVVYARADAGSVNRSDELELVARAKAGHAPAFDELF
jgi:hypothetical protein